MVSSEEISTPPSEGFSGRGGAAPRVMQWLGVGLIIVAALVAFSLYRLSRLEDEISRETHETHQALEETEKKSDAALLQASRAAASAQQAAEQRDQAKTIAANSTRQAELARQQAEAAQAQAVQAQQKAEQFRQQREQELNRLQGILSQIAETRRTAMGLIMTLGSNSIRFDFDKATLRLENREVLSRIAGVLSTLKGYHISVYGYTDDIGTQEYNLKLSERRAQAVRDYLVHAGLDPNIIDTKGFGKSDPRVRGDNPQARATNRRVEIGIVDSSLRFEGTPSSGN